jgi:hypothetical protein
VSTGGLSHWWDRWKQGGEGILTREEGRKCAPSFSGRDAIKDAKGEEVTGKFARLLVDRNQEPNLALDRQRRPMPQLRKLPYRSAKCAVLLSLGQCLGCTVGGMDAVFLSMMLSGLVVVATVLMMLLPG